MIQRSLIRRQLLSLLLVLCLPCVAILGISAQHQMTHDREYAARNMLAAAVATAQRLDDHVGEITQVLGVLSAVVGTERADTPRNDALLQELADRLPPEINTVNVWAADGSNIGAMRTELRATGLTVGQSQFFRDAADRPGLSIEAPLVSAVNGQKVAVFGLRIERDGRFAGVVTVSGRLQHLQDLLSPSGNLPPGTTIAVSDAKGLVLAHSGDAVQWIGKPVGDSVPDLAETRRQREGVRESEDAEGEMRIAGFTVATRVPWLVYIDQPKQLALGAARERLLDQVAVGGVLLIIGLIVAHWMAERIAGPLRQLGDDAARLEAGRLSHRSGVTGSGEIGSLAATLNRMAQALEQRTQLLEASEERLRQLAHYDALTGLVNRSLFMEKLNARIELAARERKAFVLLFLDVDHFKAVNDTHGHRAGDEVLIAFARALERGVAPGDTVARLAGDEFMVLLDQTDDVPIAAAVAQRLVEAVKSEVGNGRRLVRVSASVGVALHEFGESASTLLHRADEALYSAKRMGRDRVRIAFRAENRVLEPVEPAEPATES